MTRRRGLRATLAAALSACLLAPAAGATPVATNKQEHELYGRVYLEPISSVDYVQWADEFIPGTQLLEELYPRYMEFTTIDEELGDPRAVSLGPDGLPAWDPQDAGDGRPFHLIIVTDEKVPDRNKNYVFLTNAHAAEPCGREGSLRFLEDLLIWRTTDPDHVLDAATGLSGERKEITVEELLARTKIYLVDTVPDPWAAGDRANGGNLGYSNFNSGGFNTNRVAFHDGWVFPDDPVLYVNGYTTLTQPESAIVKYFERVRARELDGRPFAAAADIHGPLPVGAVLIHEQNNSPERLLRLQDFATRIEQYAPYNGPTQQLFVDNIRAILEATVVHAATLDRDAFEVGSLGGPVGFLETGRRVTSRNGVGKAPPVRPRNPVYGRVRQRPYDVSNTDYFRDLRTIVEDRVEAVTPAELPSALERLSAFVVADATVGHADALERFVRRGGTLVLTDSALRMLPDLIGVERRDVERGFAYVGYSDLVREHPWVRGLHDRARQTYDPVGLGYPLLMERDQYWPCDAQGNCEESPTQNSSPIWSVARAAWEAAGGTTIGTVDPPQDRKGGAEGQDATKTSIGVLEIGKGKLVIFGALLPMPSEEHDHWFGLNPYTVTITGQTLLLKALSDD